MRPRRYPYSGQKKRQPRDEIAELRCELSACKSTISSLSRRVLYELSKAVIQFQK